MKFLLSLMLSIRACLGKRLTKAERGTIMRFRIATFARCATYTDLYLGSESEGEDTLLKMHT